MKSFTKKVFLKINPPKKGDILGDKDRISEALYEKYGKVIFPYKILKIIYPICREAKWEITLTLIKLGESWKIIGLESGDHCNEHYGLAIDLGSTSISMRLIDLNTGKILAEESIFNDQIRFGEDILTRIFYTKGKPENLKKIQKSTFKSFYELIMIFEKRLGIKLENISMSIVSGNTTMIHFLLGIDPWSIFHYPFIPVFNDMGLFDPYDINLKIGGYMYCVPSVANYLGGDILSGLLYCEFHEKNELALFIDIGTNGEMVLGNKDYLIGGAGAAGPALEGGISKNGMKAKDGAVDSVLIKENQLILTTIGGIKPKGICGSGIVDLLAQMLLNGWIDFSGRFNEEMSERIVRRNDGFVVMYAWCNESLNNDELWFSQEDIHRFMDTKAAANTMIAYLLDYTGVNPKEIRHIYTSGAFGTFINLESAITIGLYPDLPRERFEALGNSSLKGAYAVLMNPNLINTLENIQKKIQYLEFGAATDFISQMFGARFLPHTDFNLYPTVKKELIKRGRLKVNE